MTRSDLAELQRGDSSVKRYWRINSPKSNGEQEVQFEIRNGVLHRVYSHPKVNRGKPVKQVVVPECLRRQVMELAHDSIMGGHLGVRKTADKILGVFYWPGLKADVSRFVL